MADEVERKRGEAAWKAERDAIARRNDAVRKQAQAEQKSREGVVEGRAREGARRENEQLRILNARIEKQRVQRRP